MTLRSGKRSATGNTAVLRVPPTMPTAPTPMQPVRTVREQVTERLRHAVLAGRFASGRRLKEAAPTDGLGASRGPVRDALTQQTSEGGLEYQPNCGVEVAQSADGMTWSSVPHRYKYPMDNMDVCIDLLEGARLFEALGACKQANRCREIAQRTSAAIAKFRPADPGHFAWVKGTSPKTPTLENPYPDGVVNISLAATMHQPQPRLWEDLRRKFADTPRLTPDLRLAAARRCGTPEQISVHTAAAIQRANSDGLDLQIASRLLLVPAGDAVESVTVPEKLEGNKAPADKRLAIPTP